MATLSLPPISEARFLEQVRDAARLYGWWTYHTHDSRRSAEGWPDLALLKPGRLICAELKTERGRLSGKQAKVLELLASAGVETHLWRPSQWPAIVARLADMRGEA